MRLGELMKNIFRGNIPSRASEEEISSLSSDSRKVRPGALFVALKGGVHDGNAFIAQALQKGAVAVVREGRPGVALVDGIVSFTVADSRQFLRQAIKNFYGDLSQRVRVTGITGTNGKTTITYLIESMLQSSGRPCGVVGTVNYRINGQRVSAGQTTPDFLDIQQFLAELVEQRIYHAVMEVSSHGLVQGRVDLIGFSSAVFTNLTNDHLDYHETREDYFLAKAKLFEGLSEAAAAVINVDDPYGQRLVKMTSSKKIQTYGIKTNADIMAENIEMSVGGTSFTLSAPEGHITINTPLVGVYNIYNVLAAAGVGLHEGLSLGQVKHGVELLKNVPGRLERVPVAKGFPVFVDYAHTPDALENVLQTLRKVHAGGRVIVVFGCGGDRDKTKRPVMGRIAGEMADLSIITTDNPRSEDPQSIIDQISAGFSKRNYETVLDREKAIRRAVTVAKEHDVVLIAGKGHETYQIFNDRTIDFDDRAAVIKSTA